MTRRQLIRPLVILAVAVASYLHGVPSQGNDIELLGVFAVLGGLIGLASGSHRDHEPQRTRAP